MFAWRVAEAWPRTTARHYQHPDHGQTPAFTTLWFSSCTGGCIQMIITAGVRVVCGPLVAQCTLHHHRRPSVILPAFDIAFVQQFPLPCLLCILFSYSSQCLLFERRMYFSATSAFDWLSWLTWVPLDQSQAEVTAKVHTSLKQKILWYVLFVENRMFGLWFFMKSVLSWFFIIYLFYANFHWLWLLVNNSF